MSGRFLGQSLHTPGKDGELVEWALQEVRKKRFASLSHAIDYCLNEEMKRTKGQK